MNPLPESEMLKALATLLAPIVTAGVQQLVKKMTAKRPDYEVFIDDVQRALERHFEFVTSWSKDVKFADLTRPRTVADVYVDLDLNVTPRRLRMDDEPTRHLKVTSLANFPQNIVLLGDPGAGKTTSLKRLCDLGVQTAASRGKERLVLVIVLRDLSVGESLLARALLEMGVGLTFAQSVPPGSRMELSRQVFLGVVQSLDLTLFVDGLDEVREDLRDHVEADLQSILMRSPRTRVVLTDRSADFRNNLPNCAVYELEPLSPEQVVLFTRRWLANEQLAAEFLAELNASPFADTAVRPLTLSHLCAIYSRTLRIPEKPKTVYRKIVNLLLREWDEQKGVKRTTVYSNFEADRKQEFLEHLAFYLTRAYQASRFSHEQLRTAYEAIAPNHELPKSEAAQVAREVESHTGLILQTGYERYEFAHKSLQEYLAAEYIVKYPSLPEDEMLFFYMPNELAVAVGLSSAPSRYLAELLLGLILSIDKLGQSRAQPLSKTPRYSIEIQKAVDELSAARSFFERLRLERPSLSSDEKLAAALLYCVDAFVQSLQLDQKYRRNTNDGMPSSVALLDDVAIVADQLQPEVPAMTALRSVAPVFANPSVSDAVNELERYYDVSVWPNDPRIVLLERRKSPRLYEERPIPSYLPPAVYCPSVLLSGWEIPTKH